VVSLKFNTGENTVKLSLQTAQLRLKKMSLVKQLLVHIFKGYTRGKKGCQNYFCKALRICFW